MEDIKDLTYLLRSKYKWAEMKPGRQQFQTQLHQHIFPLKDKLCIMYTHVRNIILLVVKLLLNTRIIWDYFSFVELEGVLISLGYVAIISSTHKWDTYIEYLHYSIHKYLLTVKRTSDVRS